jgi:succinate dehydrogenase hydrophobic anchor subunit
MVLFTLLVLVTFSAQADIRQVVSSHPMDEVVLTLTVIVALTYHVWVGMRDI